MSPIQEIEEYRKFTGPAEMSKSMNSLVGLLKGVAADCIISTSELLELQNWYDLHRHLIDRHPYNEIVPALEKALSRNTFEAEDAENLAWVCDKLASHGYYDLATAAIQQLHGIIQGVIADGELTSSEVVQILSWMEEHDVLSGTYPFDEIRSLFDSVLADGIITNDERAMVMAFFSQFVDTRESVSIHEPVMTELREHYSVHGVCASNPTITLLGRSFCFTGESAKATRKEIAAQIAVLGGAFSNTLTQKVDYLIVSGDGNPCWAYSCYGRKIEKAVSLQKEGSNIIIVNENDFWAAVEA